MTSFLEEIVLDLINKKVNFSKTIFILPSKRAGVILQQTIASKVKRTIFSPTILSIEEFIKKISGLESLPQADLLCLFYEVYRELTPEEKQEPFETFLSWATTLLEDINEMDRHVLDQHGIFSHLSAIQETDHWSNTAPTLLIRNYLSFWAQLPKYYELLTHKLLANNQGHQGLLYRKASEEIEFYIQQQSQKHHVFIGFNALNTSEEVIIQALLAHGNTSIYWDAEAHFLKFPNHNASQFLKKHKNQWSYFKKEEFNWIRNNYTSPKDIACIAVPENIDQVKYLSSLLSEMTQSSLEKTAIVLGEENLMLPLLNSLPANIKEVNITMGIPLDQTPISSFFKIIFDLQNSLNESRLYHKHITALLKHSLSTLVLGLPLCTEIVQYITQTKSVSLSFKTLLNLSKETESQKLLHLFFQPWNNSIAKAISNTSQLIDIALERVSYKEHPLLLEYLRGFKRSFIQLGNLCQKYNYINNIMVLERFYSDIVAKESVDLRGNPHKGLQIMGMLESRLLDFEHVFITSVNEGVLPSGKATGSYFPYDLKLHYGLPTYADKDAVYTYHFYRLLHRAQNITILYTTSSSGLGSSEKSRLLLQLEAEGIHAIKQINAAAPILPIQPTNRHIVKTAALQKKIFDYFESGISPSAIGCYLRNPLDFYYQYILGVSPSNSIEETIASNTFGTIVHHVLEALYLPFLNKTISSQDVKSMLKRSPATVDEQFKKHTNLSEVIGQNLIIYRVIQRFVENFLTMELRNLENGASLRIHSLENTLEVPFTHPTVPFNVQLKGTVDRVDILNTNMRIIDYKTGAVAQKNISIKNWEDLLAPEGKYEKAFQILFYAYMIDKINPIKESVSAGIISIKKIQNGFMPFKINNESKINASTLNDFEKMLATLLLEIANPDIPFEDSGFSY